MSSIKMFRLNFWSEKEFMRRLEKFIFPKNKLKIKLDK